MKTMTRSLLFITLAAATGSAAAQDAHAGHHGHEATAKPDPHAGHAPAVPATSPESDPHAGHAAHMAPARPAEPVPDPHAGHTMPAGAPGQADGHAGHATPMEYASHAMPSRPTTDPHAGHAMAAPAGKSADGHDTHAGHDMHAGHAQPVRADAHAGHVPAAASGTDMHAGHGDHGGHGAAAMQAPREPIPEPTAADLAAAFPTLQPHAMQHAPGFNSLVLFDHLEAWNNAHGSGQSWAAKGWFGGDIDRLWLRSEGQRSEGRLGEWSLDALYGHAISPWWDVVGGVRHDGGDAPGLTRAAIGVQGLAPYKFEFAATAYLGGPRRAELAVEAEYSLLLTNRLILQPSLEASLAADDDPRRGVGSGLGHVEAGLRLRYEITRRFAPYVGFVHERRYGRSADIHRDAGEGTRDSRWVAGVRFWF
ncbi:copper resistance protein B [Stenotrophomonas acidaminiphila]